MLWEKKIEMHELGIDQSKKADFHQFVINHIAYFDHQAWSIFLNIVLITKVEVAQEHAFFDKIKDRLIILNQEGSLDMRSQFRLNLLVNLLNSTQAN